MADSAKDFVVKQNLKVTGNIISAGLQSTFTGDGTQLDNVDAVKLNGDSAGFYRDATNLNAGTISNDRLPANITKNLTGNVTGNVDATGGAVDADSGRFTTISGTTASFDTYVGIYGDFESFDSQYDSAFTRSTFKNTRFDPAFDSALGTKSTSDLSEGSNLYYTTNRFDSDFATKTTTELGEGSNLYYTEARVDSDITGTVTKTFVDALNINAAQLDGIEASQFVRSNTDDQITAHIQFTDGYETRYGNGNDLRIKHTGARSTLNQVGFGDLALQADGTDRFVITDNGTTASGPMSADSITSTGNITADFDIEAKRDIYVDGNLWVMESTNGGISGHIQGNADQGLELHYHGQTSGGGFKIITHDDVAQTTELQVQFTASNGISFENNVLKNVADPVTNQDAATKAYVDNTSQGLTVKDGVRAASTADLSTLPNIGTVTYSNTAGPDSGVGSGFSFTGQLDSIDGYQLTTDDRVLIKDQTNKFENGIYRWVNATTLTRAPDADQDSELGGGVFVFVENGNTNASNGYVTSHSGQTNVGTDDVLWTQFSGAGFIEAGEALVKTGNVIDLSLNADSVSGTSGLKIENDQLKINLSSGGGLEITSNVLKIPTTGIKASMLDFGTGANQISTSEVPEDSAANKFYFSDAKARAALSYDSTGIVTYNSTTGVISSLSVDSIFSQKFASLDSSTISIGFDAYHDSVPAGSAAATKSVFLGVSAGKSMGDGATGTPTLNTIIGHEAASEISGSPFDIVAIGQGVLNSTGHATATSDPRQYMRYLTSIGNYAGGGYGDVSLGWRANSYSRHASSGAAGFNVAVGYMAGAADGANGTKGPHQSVLVGAMTHQAINTTDVENAKYSVTAGFEAGRFVGSLNSVILGHNAARGASSNNDQSGRTNKSVIIGTGAATNTYPGALSSNVVIGYNAGQFLGYNNNTSSSNVIIGSEAGQSLGRYSDGFGANQVVIGQGAMGINTYRPGGSNVVIGTSAGNRLDSGGENNIIIGTYAGQGTRDGGSTAPWKGSNNILIGMGASVDSASRNNTLVLGGYRTDLDWDIRRIEIPGMTDPSVGHGVGSILTLLLDSHGNRHIGFDSAPAVLDSVTVAPYARAAINVAGEGIAYDQSTGTITVQTLTNSFEVSQSGHGLKEGNAVYEDDTLGWVKALATDSGEKLASHVVVGFVDSNTFQIAQNGIFTLSTANPAKAQVYTPGEYYYLSNLDSGLALDAQPNTSVQPLFYALDSDKIELNVEHAINVFSPDEPINVSRTAGNFTVSGNLKIEGLGVPRVTTLSSGDTYSFDSGNVAKIEFNADASLVFDSPGTTYDGAGFTILAKNTHATNDYRLTLTTPNGVTLNTVNENKVIVNAGKFAIISGLIYGEKDIILTSTQTDSATTG